MSTPHPSLFSTPLPYLLTALGYLGAAVLWGLALLHLPEAFSGFWSRWLHVHLAVAGGALQIILGAMLFFLPALLRLPPYPPARHRGFYIGLNLALILLFAGVLTESGILARFGNLLLLFGVMIFGGLLLQGIRRSLGRADLNAWYYGSAMAAFLVGSALADGLLGGPLQAFFNHTSLRSAHLHAMLLGFVGLTAAGTLHNLFPTVLGKPLWSRRLIPWQFFLHGAGVAALVLGLLAPAAAGAAILGGIALLIALTLLTLNLWATALPALARAPVAAYHLLFAASWLTATAGLGLQVGVYPGNAALLMALSHIGMVGFLLQIVMGGAAYLLPVMLALSASKQQFERRTVWTAALNRGNPAQCLLLNLGVLAFLLHAIGALPAGLLVPAYDLSAAAFLLFLGKVTWVMGPWLRRR
jgi:nitrite reductase (NO-forming)